MFETTPTTPLRRGTMCRLVGDCRFGSGVSRARIVHAVASLAIALSAALALSSSVEAQLGVGGLQRGDANRDHMEIVGWWGGPVRDVAVEGDIAVCAIGTRVVVLDVFDQMDPHRTDEIDLGYYVRDVELRDGYAYVVTSNTLLAGNTHQFTIIDVRDPGSATIVYNTPSLDAGGGWGNGGGQYVAVELYGPYALIPYGSGRIHVFNVAAPEQTSFIQECEWSDLLNPEDLLIEGNYLFFVDTGPDDTINIYDLSVDVFEPPLVGSVQVDDAHFTAIAVKDDLLAVVNTSDYSVLVFDVSDPANPSYNGSATGFTSGLSDVSIANDYLCVADYTTVGWNGGKPQWDMTSGLSIYDIGNGPGDPVFMNSLKTHGTTRGVVTAGNIAYTFDDGEGLVLVNIQNPMAPERLGTYYSPATLRQMAKAGNFLYVTDEWNGFTIINVAQPAYPSVTGVYQSPEWGYADHFGITVRDNWAIFAAGYGGVHVVDVVDPTNPTKVFDHDFGAEQFTGAIEIDGDIVRVGWRNDFTNFSFKNPPNLTFVANVGGAHGAMAIATTDEGVTHIARRRHTVVDNSDPTNPQILSNNLDVRAIDLVVDGDYVFTNGMFGSDNGGGFYVRNISDPATPITVWHYPIDEAKAVARFGSKVFFSARSGPNSEFPEPGLFQFDATNAESPVLLNYLRVDGISVEGRFGLERDGSLDLLAESGVVYATTSEGLAVIQVGGARRPKAAMSILGR